MHTCPQLQELTRQQLRKVLRMQVLLYTPLKGTNYLQIVSSLLLLLSFFAGVTAVALMWRTSPAEYNHRQYLSDALYFFRTQRLGYLPSGSDVAWRSDALTYELGPGSVDLTGGWLTGIHASLLLRRRFDISAERMLFCVEACSCSA